MDIETKALIFVGLVIGGFIFAFVKMTQMDNEMIEAGYRKSNVPGVGVTWVKP